MMLKNELIDRAIFEYEDRNGVKPGYIFVSPSIKRELFIERGLSYSEDYRYINLMYGGAKSYYDVMVIEEAEDNFVFVGTRAELDDYLFRRSLDDYLFRRSLEEVLNE